MIKGGYGLAGDMIAGPIGAPGAGFANAIIVTGEAGFRGNIIGAVLGAWVLIAIFRFLTIGRTQT